MYIFEIRYRKLRGRRTYYRTNIMVMDGIIKAEYPTYRILLMQKGKVFVVKHKVQNLVII